MTRGLDATAACWPPIAKAYGWVHRAAQLLNHPEPQPVERRRREYRELLGEMRREKEALGPLAPAADHFVKVTKSYWTGLFRCYEVPDLPRTNNDLEQLFGSARYHERRASGRKGASPGLVVRGAARIVAAIATRTRPYGPDELRPRDLTEWRHLRAQLDARSEARRRQLRFRRAPTAFLAELEARLIHPSLPP